MSEADTQKNTIDPYAEYHLGHGVVEEDKILARKDKNAPDFAFSYSKLWCLFCKNLVLSLEKRAQYESEYFRNLSKQFSVLENSIINSTGAPMMKECITMSRMLLEQSKDVELNNSKRYRELTEVINRQRTEFTKTRKFLKEKWKADVKRMVDAESSLAKSRSSYFQKCQAGIKLREDLAMAQTLLNDLLNQESYLASNPSNNTGSSITPESSSSTGDDTQTSSVDSAITNQIAKQRNKVDGLEKKLGDNDKKEMELMYAFRESVETANKRMVEFEKSKVEILCDTRLTVIKCDEIMRDSLVEIFEHLFNSRKNMIDQFYSMASDFRLYEPCSQYHSLILAHVDQKPDIAIEKYHFEGYHELVTKEKPEALSRFGFVSRFGSTYGPGKDPDASGDARGDRHSDSESDEDTMANLAMCPGKSTMLNSLVEFGSNLFRPDSKKISIRNRLKPNPVNMSAGSTSPSPLELEAAESLLAKEITINTTSIAYCITGIENQPEGLSTHGIYRVPASKSKVAYVLDLLLQEQNAFADGSLGNGLDLTTEHPLTLASVIKGRLIALSEPLFTYTLYNNFIEIGKSIEGQEPGSQIYDQMILKLASLFDSMRPEFRRIIGLLFHHLHRVSQNQEANQMGPTNLGTMFGPTVMRQKPKFQVANMMEFVDNKAQTKLVEVMIEEVSRIFKPAYDFTPNSVLQQIDLELLRGDKTSLDCDGSESIDEIALTSLPILHVKSPPATLISSQLPVYKPYSESNLFPQHISTTSTASNFIDQSTSKSFKLQEKESIYHLNADNNLIHESSPRDNSSHTSSSIDNLAESENLQKSNKVSPIFMPATRTVSTGATLESSKNTSGPAISQSISTVSLSSNSSSGPKECGVLGSSTSNAATSMVSSLKRLVSSGSQQIQQHLQMLSSNKEDKQSDIPTPAISSLVIGRKKVRGSFSLISTKKSEDQPRIHDLATSSFSTVDASDLEFADEYEGD